MGRVAIGKVGITAAARDRYCVQLGRFEGHLLIRAVGVPARGAAPVDPHVELAVGIELVDAEESDFGRFRMARALRRVQLELPEATAVAHVLGQCELLVAHHNHVVVEPRAVNSAEGRIVERADVDAGNLGGDLRSQASYLNHAPSRFYRLCRIDPIRLARRLSISGAEAAAGSLQTHNTCTSSGRVAGWPVAEPILPALGTA